MNVSPLSPLVALSPNSSLQATNTVSSTGGASFAAILNDLVKSNTQANEAVNKAVTDLATGETQDLHTVGLAVAQADLNFRLILQIRNRLTEAVQEILRTQV